MSGGCADACGPVLRERRRGLHRAPFVQERATDAPVAASRRRREQRLVDQVALRMAAAEAMRECAHRVQLPDRFDIVARA